MIYEVAMKSITHKFNQSEKIKLLQEAAIMGQFHHPNVLQLYGVVVHFDEVSTQFKKSVPQLQAWYFASSDQQKLCTWGT